MCQSKYCPIGYGAFDCEYYIAGECEYEGGG